MLRFKNKIFTPPGGAWFYRVPETGVQFTCRTGMKELLPKIRQHYDANKLTVPENLPELVEHFICVHVDESFCEGESLPGEPKRKKRLGFFDIMKFTEVLFKRYSVSPDKFFVKQDVADSRAQTCMKCNQNLLGICTSCTGLKEWAAKLVANRKTKYDSCIGVCSVCGCVLSSKIHVGVEYLGETEESLSEAPAECWVKKEMKL